MDNFIITAELQKTVKDNKHITHVYIGANGRHYFNIHVLPKDKKDTNKDNWKKYGQGIESHTQIIPGIFNTDRISEKIAKGVPETLIVNEFTKDEILNFEVKTYGAKFIKDIADLKPSERKAARELLKDDEEGEFDLDKDKVQ